MKNRIRAIIKKKGYKNLNDFAVKNDISPQRVQYWIKAKKQSKALDESIKMYLGTDKYIY